MIDNLQPYPEYKQAGVPWLDTIPVDWRMLRGKNLFRIIDVRSETGNEELLTVSSSDGIVPRSQKAVTMFKAESYVGHKLCWPQDLVINSLWAWMQGLGFSHYHGLVSSAYSVYRLRSEFVEYWRYFHYVLRSAAYKWELQTRSKGVWLSRLQLSDAAFLDMPIIVPPIDDTAAIVRYLDHADRRIRRYIRTKQTLIKLLNEQKQIIIQQAVTGGLIPDAPRKKSGVEWLGAVPEYWEERPAKYFFREIDERSETGREELMSVSHITGVTPRSQKNITMFMASSYIGHKLCSPGDLVINTMWAWMGALGVANQRGIVSSSYGVYRPLSDDKFVPAFADHLLRIKPYISEYTCRSSGIRSSRLRLYPEKFLTIPIICPPYREQQQIVAFIEQEIKQVQVVIERTEREINLMREYHARLITDIVTGKLDIRTVAAQLPNEIDEPDLLDEIDDLIEADDDMVEVIEETSEE